MGRLTFEGNFCDIAQCFETRGGKHCPDGYCSQRRVWERLKEYEDAEQDGRLMALPCRIGDVVYIPAKKSVRQFIVDRIYVISGGKLKIRLNDIVFATKPIILTKEQFFEKVFHTYEEAESALKKGDGKDGVVD